MKIRTYTELVARDTFLSRYEYLALGGQVGLSTFGHERQLNQSFYASWEWKRARDIAIIRDKGCDLGVPGHEIFDRVLVHHMNPIELGDLVNFNPDVLDPEYLICVSNQTHNAIHFADASQLPQPMIERKPGDTTPWERQW